MEHEKNSNNEDGFDCEFDDDWFSELKKPNKFDEM